MIQLDDLGFVELSEKIIVSDPGCDRGAWSLIEDLTMEPGKYKAFLVKKDKGKWGVRVSHIICVLASEYPDIKTALERRWSKLDTICIDSGQAGVFDNSAYPNSAAKWGSFDDADSFYGECCSITVHGGGGVMRSGKGVVVSSGYGDGIYEVKALISNGRRNAVMIDFGVSTKRHIMAALASYQISSSNNM